VTTTLPAAPRSAPIPRLPPGDRQQLSYSQQGIWRREQLYPGKPTYNTIRVLDLRGPLAGERLRRALQTLVDRHDVLRARFTARGSEPVQSFPPAAVDLPAADLTLVPAGGQAAEAQPRLRELLEIPFDLAAGPPFRFCLFRLAGERHLLLLCFHHLVIDGASHHQIVSEVLALYRGVALPPPRLQFRDFVAWQREQVEAGELAAARRYWLERLAGELPILDLPTDRPRPSSPSHVGSWVQLPLGAALRDALAALAAQRATTLFRIFCAAFQVLLHRLTGARDVLVGAPFAGRTHPDLDEPIGCFVTTLPLRTDLAGDPTFAAAVARVSETVSEAKRHQGYPFEKLLEELATGRDLLRSPIFSAAVLQRPLTRSQRAGDLLVGHWEQAPNIAPYELMATESETATGMQVLLNYRPELFDRTTIQRWAASFGRLLDAAVADPAARISALPLLGAAERHQTLAEWNDTARSAKEGERLVHELFAEQAARTPEAVAVVDDGGALTYRGLAQRANQIAHLLRALGVRRGSAVGVHLERSAEMVAALLAVLKAGGTYVPLDAAVPEERIRFILAQLKARHLVTCQELWARWGAPPRLDGAVVLDAPAGGALTDGGRLGGRAEIGVQPRGNPPVDGSAADLAYVIFTSGSTGLPKGVAVRHRSVGNLIAWINRDFGVGPDDRVLFLAAMGFDLSVYDVFGLLAAGGSVRVVAQSDVRDPERLLALLLAEPITFWDSAPAALQQLTPFLPALPPPGARSLCRVFLSGDWIPTTLPDRVRAAFPAARVTALGGATEATVWSNSFPIAAVDPRWASIPYGRPMPNGRYHVLDTAFEPCPTGVAGDLYIAGDCLAVGYAGEPAQTAERFVPDPFGAAGERLYWTGDRARHLADGNLEFLGRRDQQVKIRGFRVELGEIEAVLSQHPAVADAVVIADGAVGEMGEKGLVGYVVPRGEGAGSDALRAHLAARLPEYMVPAVLVTLGALPVTANGKLDRQALPRPDRASFGIAREAAPPRTPTEAALARLWSEVLAASPIGVHDDFFALGGHSLLATRLASRLREALAVELPLPVFFEAPTIAALARRIEALRGTADEAALPPLRPRPPGGAAPLSFAQQRLWFLDQLEPGTALYNVPFSLRLRGALDGPALVRSLAEIVRRHEVLRTVFPSEGGRPCQVVRPAAALPLPRIDLRALPAPSGARALRDFAARFTVQPFDLAAGPLVRAVLVELAVDERVLFVNLHHIVSDGWSIGVFLGELQALYGAAAAGRPALLPELPVQYADFAVWQSAWLAGARLAEQLSYWRQSLAGAPPLLELPADRPRPPAPSYRGAQRILFLPAALTDELRRSGGRSGATLFMTLLAAFQLLVAHATGEDDVPVGSPIANRRRAEVEGLIGFFVNLLVLRGDLSGDPSFDQLLRATRETALAAYAHQDVPFEQLVDELHTERDLRHAPLFQTLFALQNDPWETLRLPGLTITLEPLDGTLARYDLSLVLTAAGGGLQGWLTYSRDLFDATTALRLAQRFVRLVGEVAAGPERRLSQLGRLSGAEAHQLRCEWNEPPVAPAAGPSLFALVAAQADASAARVAVSAADEQISYAELVARARRLAQLLGQSGVGPDVPVAVCCERSPQMILALLAVLAAGGAYVPLDPGYPAPHLAFLLADSGAALLLTERRLTPLLAGLGAAGAIPVLCLDDLPGAPESRSGAAGLPEIDPDQLAYVIYTSGSSGRPKGVMVAHRQAAQSTRARLLYYGRPADERFALLSSFAFDSSVAGIFGTLAAGGTLLLPPEELPRDPEGLARWVSRERATALLALPLLYSLLLDSGADAALAFGSLRQAIVAGEAFPEEVVRRHFQRLPGAALANEYGPTEAAVWSSVYDCRGIGERGRVPIGHPISGAQIYLLDRRQQIVAWGVTGELFVGGAGVARGYLRRPDLTAERFVPDSLGGVPGARLYRTGDLARLTPGGELEFLGRVDLQVKIRGYRIEPEEVEAALRTHPAVREAVVVVREDERGHRGLVAYLTGDFAVPVDLRTFLKQRFPDHMVPALFVPLAELPLTANGKVDRRALPVPAAGRLTTAAPGSPSPYEALVAGIFSAVLGREEVGPEDDFFDLGGHSLLVAQVRSRLREALDLDLPLREIFERPKVAELAARLAEAKRGTATEPPLLPAAAVEERRRAPLSFAQERLWILDRMAPNSPVYNIPAALRLRGRLAESALRQALADLVRRQASLRTRFERVDGEPVQVVTPPGAWPLPVADLSELDTERREAESRHQAEAEARRPFDLARGPLLRTLLLRLDAARQEHVLVVGMHHIVSDGESVNIFFRELASLYEAAVAGRAAALPELPVQYTDYARWQRGWTPRDAAVQLGYWRRQLEGAPACLELPNDHPRPPVQTDHGGRVVHPLPAELCAALRRLARGANATFFMALLASFNALLLRWSGQGDLAIGTPVSNRHRVQIEGLVGFFVNALVLRTELGPDLPFDALLAQVRRVALGAYDHQDLPFEQLVEALKPQRDLRYPPLFQVMFSLHESTVTSRQLPGLVLSSLRLDSGLAKFDLSLILQQDERGLLAAFEYNSDLFDPTTLARLSQQLETLLAGVVARPAAAICALPILGPAQVSQLFLEWNDTAVGPAPLLATELLAAHAAATPDAVAARCGAGRLSFAELERRAHRLAHDLRALGVGVETPVGLHLLRDLDLLSAIFGIWLAGGAFVPLPPDHPPQRLTFVLEDAGIPVVVTRTELAASLPEHRAAVVCLDTVLAAAHGGPPAPPVRVIPESLAYVIYTSGSTGRPKGTLVSHDGLANYMSFCRTAYPLTGGTPVYSSLSFDLTLTCLLAPFAAGQPATMLPGSHPIEALAAALRPPVEAAAGGGETAGWGFVKLTPAHLEILSHEFAPAELAGRMEALLIGGEALRFEKLAPWRALSRPRLINLYGPTEAVIACSFYEVGEKDPQAGPVPIGWPITGIRLHVVGAVLETLPPGSPGELCVAGVGLARGYLGRPDLTAVRFVPDPFSPVPGGRLYRTGDHARHRADGALEFLGRIDRQVKLRGYRIEPGEVEAALERHPGVRAAAVLVRDDLAGGRGLAAYWVAAHQPPVPAEELRRCLAGELPEYMVPAAFTRLAELPLNRHGKVDPKALPVPEELSRAPTAVWAAPENELERTLARVLEEILRLPQVGRDDNFFDLGAHSLTLVRVHERLRDLALAELSVLDLFRYPTVRGLAHHLGHGAAAGSPTPAEEGAARTEIRTAARDPRRQRADQRRSLRS